MKIDPIHVSPWNFPKIYYTTSNFETSFLEARNATSAFIIFNMEMTVSRAYSNNCIATSRIRFKYDLLKT